jgi:uncharacterized protein (TIGR03437 family)
MSMSLPHLKTTRVRLLATLCVTVAALAAIHATRNTLLPAAHAQGAATASTDAPVADFNGDGILDFAYNNLGEDGTVAVRLGNGDGTTRLVAKYVLGTNVSRVRKGDFDNDGKPDLAVAHQKSGVDGFYLTLLLGRGDGTFTPRAAGAGGLFAVGDFNNDGKADLSYGGVTMLGRGDATFTPSQQSPFARDIVRDIAAGDFDNDGKLDLAFANNVRGVTLLFGQGDGTFSDQTDYPTAGQVWLATAADLDGDGKLDLVTANEYGARFSFLYNQGGRTFGSRRDYVAQGLNYVDALAAADFNGDGKLEVAALGGNSEQATLALFPGECGGRFGAPQFLEAWQTATLLAGDFDGNGKPDLVAPVGESGAVTYIKTHLNPNVGPTAGTCPPDAWLAAVSFSTPVASKAAPRQTSLAAADFNLDGKPDLAAVNIDDQAGVSVYLNDGAGRFPDWTSGSFIPIGGAGMVFPADVNGDAKTDLLVMRNGQFNNPTGGVTVVPLVGRGDGTFAQLADIYIGTYTEALIIYPAAGDFNKDGKLDFALATEGGRVLVYLGGGDGTFSAPTAYTVSTNGAINDLVAADFDGDGKLDLATAGGRFDTYFILYGKGDGTFAPREVTPQGLPVGYPSGGKGSTDLAVGDFNSDGRPDLLILNGGTPVVTILLSNGDRTFTHQHTYPEYGGGMGSGVVGDFNKDGKLDLTYVSSNSIIVMPGLGDGTFARALLADTKSQASASTAADFDGDGRLDLAAARNSCAAACASTIAIFFNSTTSANPPATPRPTPSPTPTPTPPVITYTIRGRVSDAAGRGVRLADVMLTGAQTAAKKSEVAGHFQFTGLPRGSYTVTVGGAGYNYSPRSQTVADLNGDAVLNFTATPAHQMVTVAAPTYEQGELAFEAIASIFGANLSTASDIAISQPLPLTLGGSTVTVRDSQGNERLAPLFYVSPTQINYQIPVGTAAGVATVYVTSSNGTASACQVTISQVRPGFFTANSSGRGLAAADVQRVKADGQQSFERVAHFDALGQLVPTPIDLGPEGEQVYLVLYGTGLRFRTGIGSVTATVGGYAASVVYAGPQPQFAGLDQVNVLIPRAAQGAGDVDVTITFDGKAANTVKVRVK